MSGVMFGIKSFADNAYLTRRLDLAHSLRNSPIPDDELLNNLGIYMERMHLSRILLMNDLYKRIIHVPGVIIEFGVRWGENIALFNAFRGMYEPYNYTRRVIGFDTFSGFPDVMSQDMTNDENPVKAGDYAVSKDWQNILEEILRHHDALSPLPHLKKCELVAGDATKTFPDYLKEHPEVIVSLAYFDFDLYYPTKECLSLLIPRLTKGSIVVFDELNHPAFPGETIAVQEVLGVNTIQLERDSNNPAVSWFEVR